MTEPIGQKPARVYYYQGNPKYPFTVIDNNGNGVLRPEEGDIIYEGKPDALFPTFNRINHSLWKDQKTEDVEKIIDQYMEKKKNFLWTIIGVGALTCLVVIFLRWPSLRSLLLKQDQGNSTYPPNFT